MAARILVVDDDAHLRESLRDNLEMAGYEVVEAPSGAEALKAVVTGFYDVILMDFNLTDSTGIEVIRGIRRVNSDSQILMMTAHASLDTALKAIQESVYDFLVKPVDVSYLKRTIAKCLEKLRLEQENQRLIRELKKANELLLNLSNMKSKFMSMASHDLSNSLMALQISFEMLGSTLSPTQEQKKRIDTISSGISQIARLIEDLVDWASIEQGKLRLERDRASIEQVVQEALAGPQAKAAQRGVALELRLAPGLPPVLVDRRRIGQVLGNLLENALRYTPGGGRVTVAAAPARGGEVELSVQDTGEGIAPQDLGRIFESFYQGGEGGGPDHGRLGLGLSIAREIVLGHGGRIWVDSAGHGKGATFRFTLPVAP